MSENSMSSATRRVIARTSRVGLVVILSVFFAGRGVSQETLLPFGSDGWDYFVGSEAPSDPMSDWRQPDFVLPPAPAPLPDPLVGVWVSDASTPIGYGGGAKGIATTIPDSEAGNYSTVYFRRILNIEDVGEITLLTLNTQHDDGFVLYLNGVEAARHNVSAGTEDDFLAFASGGHEYDDTPNSFDITAVVAELTNGDNTIAVEVKNVGSTSSDLVMNLEIIASNELDALCPGSPVCQRGVDAATISWVNNPEAAYDSIAVTRDGVAIAGSPFAGDTESVVDVAGNDGGHDYAIIATMGDFDCPPLLCATSSEICVIEVGQEWSYFKGESEPSPDIDDGSATLEWTEPDFDDSSWETGPSGLGYGDDDDATVLDDMEDIYSTVYVRRTFSVNDPVNLTLQIDYDDSFVAYLNGVEVARSNVGAAGEVQPFDSLADGNHEAGAVETFPIAAIDVAAGDNVLAIQGINTTIGSSDFSLIPRLCMGGIICSDTADINCDRTGDGVLVSWTNNPDGSYDGITVTRDGEEIAGSPFAGDTESILDADAPAASPDSPIVYEVTHFSGTDRCDALSCTVEDNAVVLCAEGDTWQFFRGTEEPSPDADDGSPTTAWTERDFDDSSWDSGPSGFGYGDGDDATLLEDMMPQVDDPATPDVDESSPGYSTVYLRKLINLPGVVSLALSINYDDGFIAYFNGVEFARAEVGGLEVMPASEFSAGNHEAAGAEVFGIPQNLIEVGENLIAIQGANQAITSSDFSLIPEVVRGAEIPVANLTCIADEEAGEVTLAWSVSTHEEYIVTRNGIEIAGSPFPAGTTGVVDSSPDQADNVYELTGVLGGVLGDSIACTVDCEDLFPDVITCVLELVDSLTAATLSWTIDPPGTDMIEVRREGQVVESLAAGVNSATDPDVEAPGPAAELDYSVHFLDADGLEICAITCASLSLCPEDLSCDVVAGNVELTWGNIVKAWDSFTILRDGTEIGVGVPGDSTGFTDDTVDLLPGIAVNYTLSPVAPPGGEVACDLVCVAIQSIAELARYVAPDGDWDYSIDFDVGDDQYNPNTLEAGNLDGTWIRAAADMWGGSAPLDSGEAPDGDRPGGLGVESVAELGECDEDASVLRMLDPGDPGNPGGSLSTEFPNPFNAPDNSLFVLGRDTGVDDRNLLRDGVTIAGRFRINPDAPAYLNATANGDGSPISDGLGQLGIYFLDDGSLGTEGAPAGLSLNLNSGNVMQMSTDPVTEHADTVATTFRSFWATVEDPEGDDTYNVTFYINGNRTEFSVFGTANDVALQAATDADFGASVGNFLVLSMPSAGNDGDIQIDWFAYKAGVHPPSVVDCAPCENTPPDAAVSVDPGTTVELDGGPVEVTLDGSGSDDGDGGTQGLNYSWSAISGPDSAVIATSDGDATVVTFSEGGVYTFRLVVNDGEACNFSDSAFVTITVDVGCLNALPTADIAVASTEIELFNGVATITLDAGGSSDGEGGAQGLSVNWTKDSGPEGDTIDSPTSDFTLLTLTAGGSYTYRLTVDDGQDCNNTASATVTITVTDPGCQNTEPTASIRVIPGETVLLIDGAATVVLDGTGSVDGDKGAQDLTHSWAKTSGPAGDVITSPDANVTVVNFTTEGSYSYELTVDDGQNCDSVAMTSVTITVTDPGCQNTAPTASIVATPGTEVLISDGAATVDLDGSGSDDGDKGIQGLLYSWAKTSGPAGDSIVSSDTISTVVNFTAEGSYTYELTVDDGENCNNSAAASVTITVTDPGCQNSLPTASIEVTPGTTVVLTGGAVSIVLDGTGSDDGDKGAQGLSYSWAKTSGPAGDSISSPDADVTVVDFTTEGSYTYELTVDDGQNCDSAATASVTITVEPDVGVGTLLLRGDVDNSGNLSLTDGVGIFNFLFTGIGLPPSCPDAMDSNDDGNVNLTDGVNILNVLFLGFGEIAPPSVNEGVCGEDTTEDGLAECVYTGPCP